MIPHIYKFSLIVCEWFSCISSHSWGKYWWFYSSL